MGLRRVRSEAAVASFLLAPACIFLIALFVMPVGFVLVLSVTDPTISVDHYTRIVSVPLYTRVMINTFETSLIVTVLALLMGYPLAYVTARRNDGVALALLAIVGMSFWTGLLVRTYAWLVILGNQGPVAALYHSLGLGQPPQLLFTSFSSTLAMTNILLPYMVLALYSVMRRIDPTHLHAASSLGAPPLAAFLTVFLPLSLPGVVNGSLLVFSLCIGFYVTPMLLGSPREMMIAQLISQQVEELLAWGFASALAVALLVVAAVSIVGYSRLTNLDRLEG